MHAWYEATCPRTACNAMQCKPTLLCSPDMVSALPSELTDAEQSQALRAAIAQQLVPILQRCHVIFAISVVALDGPSQDLDVC